MRHSTSKCLLSISVALLMGLGAHRAGQARTGPPLVAPPLESQINDFPSGREERESAPAPLKKDEPDCDECVIVKAPIRAQEPGGSLARTLWGLFWVLGPGRRKTKSRDALPASTA